MNKPDHTSQLHEHFPVPSSVNRSEWEMEIRRRGQADVIADRCAGLSCTKMQGTLCGPQGSLRMGHMALGYLLVDSLISLHSGRYFNWECASASLFIKEGLALDLWLTHYS